MKPKGTSKLRAVAYYRVSSDEQKEKDSIGSQKLAIREYAERSGYGNLVDEYQDEAVSGATDFHKRDGGGQLLRDAALGKFDVVLVFSLSRLSRAGDYALKTLLKSLAATDVEVISLNDDVDMQTAEGRLMLSVKGYQAEKERANIRANTMSGKRRAAIDGKWNGGAYPYGYRPALVNPNNPGSGVKLAIDSDKAKIVRRIFKSYLAGDSTLTIARQLNDEAVPLPNDGGRRKGTMWQMSSVAHILRNRIYVGEYIYNRRSVITEDARTGDYLDKPITKPKDASLHITFAIPSIVSQSDFDQVQAILSNRPAGRARRHRLGDGVESFFLRGLVTCGACGSRVGGFSVSKQLATGEKRRYAYYQCNRSRQPTTALMRGHELCLMGKIKVDLFDSIIIKQLELLLSNPDEVIRQFEEAQKTKAADADARMGQLEADQGRIDDLEGQRARLSRLIVKKVVNEADGESQLAEITSELKKLSAGVDRLRRGGKGASADFIRKSSAGLKKIWKRRKPKTQDEWRAFMLDIGAGVEIQPDWSIGIAFQFSQEVPDDMNDGDSSRRGLPPVDKADS